MNILRYTGLLFFLIADFFMAFGQDNIPPEKPVITFVTVDTATNDVIINWTESISPDVLRYIIYYEIRTLNGYEGVRLDSVPAGNSTYIHSGSQAGLKTILYSVTALDTAGNESIRKPGLHSTIHSEIFYDSCNHSNIVSWNRYFGWNTNVSGYRIYGRAGNGSFVLLNGNASSDTVYVHHGITENILYNYYIEGIKNDGLISSSNISVKYTYAPDPPGVMALNYATVKDDNTIEISFEFPDTSEVNDFALLRSGDPDGTFSILKYMLNVDSSPVTFTDNVSTGLEKYYYRIGAVNSCLSVIGTSNLGSSILLTVENNEMSNILRWNNYINFPGGISGYEIYRLNPSGDYVLIGTSSSSGTEFYDNLSEISGESYEGEIIYKIHAISQVAGIISVSNLCMVEVKTEIFVPTAFTPNADGKNDVFKPVMDFLPGDYLMIITNRYGTVIYSSADPLEGWDGTINNNKPAPEGIYKYYIKCTSHTGQKILRQGPVTLFYP